MSHAALVDHSGSDLERLPPPPPRSCLVSHRLDHRRQEPLEIVSTALGSRGVGLVLDVRIG